MAGNSATRNMVTEIGKPELPVTYGVRRHVTLSEEEKTTLLNSDNADDVIYLAQHISDSPHHRKNWDTIHALVVDKDIEVQEALFTNGELSDKDYYTMLSDFAFQEDSVCYPKIKALAEELKYVSRTGKSLRNDDIGRMAYGKWRERCLYRHATGLSEWSKRDEDEATAIVLASERKGKGKERWVDGGLHPST